MKAMESIYDLIEEAKVRTIWWALCIFAISYFLSNTSKSIWMNIPVSILLAVGLRILSEKVDLHWKPQSSPRLQTYLSHLERKQLSPKDPCFNNTPPPPKWKRKIDSPIVESAMSEFIDRLLKEFVVDLWYSEITPDKEFPELIHATVMDVLGEISDRVKQINVVDLLTRDIVDLIGDHIDLFRRNQAAIGVEVMGTLSSEERDERLKYHLMASKELHPALISPDSEYKVLQRLIGGLIAVVLNPREAQCPLIQSIARELVTCLVMQPIMNFACPGYINELIELILLAITKDDKTEEVGAHQSINTLGYQPEQSVAASSVHSSRKSSSLIYQRTDMSSDDVDSSLKTRSDYNAFQEEPLQTQSADWGRMLEAATQRRTEVLTPENLENMWTKGRNYKKKERKNVKIGVQKPMKKVSGTNSTTTTRTLGKDFVVNSPGISAGIEERAIVHRTPDLGVETHDANRLQFSHDLGKGSFKVADLVNEFQDTSSGGGNESKSRLKRSNSTSALKSQMDVKRPFSGDSGGSIISEFYGPNFTKTSERNTANTSSDIVLHNEVANVPKLKCRVMGAYFEKLGSKSFAVYSIAVTDAEKRTWFVKRRYSNFERLHRHLKDIPNYTLHLPPKRIFSSSTEDAFVHQRCIQLDKYLQDLLLIANVAEQHEVWDFLSASSKNYAFGKSSSVMRTLAVNVDDAVDDIVRQFKGVSDGLIRKVSGPLSYPYEASSVSGRNFSWNADDIIEKQLSIPSTTETANSISDHEEGGKDGCNDDEEVGCSAQATGWHSDNELNSRGFPPRVIQHAKLSKKNDSSKKYNIEVNSGWIGQGGLEDPVGMPPEWTPPNVSVPLLNLVDNVFQLKRRGWLRRQVFWISKQILQLVMEDAIDDWLLGQIHWLRRDDVIAQGIKWLQDVLWPDGTFFIKLRNPENEADDSEKKNFQSTNQFGGLNKVSKPAAFELQLEAARRASDVKKMIFEGAPTPLVSLIGQKQYKRCAKDIYYFIQSTICVKQLAYTILELLLVSVFPELREVVVDIREDLRSEQSV